MGHDLTNAIGESIALSDEELSQAYENQNGLSTEDLQDLGGDVYER